MTAKDFNIIISSKQKLQDETNNRVSIQMNDPIHIMEDESCEVCLKLFHTTKTFYNCQNGVNNHFRIMVFNTNQNHLGDPLHDWDIYIPEGNYNVLTFTNMLKELCVNKLDVAYDSRLNKYVFTNSHHQNRDVDLQIYDCGSFLGFSDNTIYHIDDGTDIITSIYPVNMAGFDNLLIEMGGNLALVDTYTNIKNKLNDNLFKTDRILGIITVADIQPMDSIKFENSDCLYSSKVMNKVIDRFEINIINEKLQTIMIGEWVMVLGFKIIKKEEIALKWFMKIYEVLDNIQYYIMKMISALGLYPNITTDDMEI